MVVAANIFQPLIDVFESVLTFFHNSLGVPWGWAIVLLTVCVRAVLIPLTVKQFHSMQKMQMLGPEMKSIQAKYKDDKERQNQELMKFYRENGVNPLGSCLPLVLQLPVFISLYYMLRTSLRLDICPQSQPGAHMVNGHWVGISTAHTVPCGPHNGASFLFIPDLTNKASGAVLVVLIVLYVGTQLASSMMMANPTMDPTQRKLMMFLPLVFVLFVINFPAGVLVYWITTNTWTMGQQYIIKRRIGPVTPVGSAAGGATATATSVVPTSRRPSAVKDGATDGAAAAKTTARTDGEGATNGSGAGGLAGLLKGRSGKADKEPETVAAPVRSGPPPRPPRKKKKRSGRRR